MSRWFHGTSLKNASSILASGTFHIGTWFAASKMDALAFGGPYIFEVEMEIDDNPLGWQIHMANEIATNAVVTHGVHI